MEEAEAGAREQHDDDDDDDDDDDGEAVKVLDWKREISWRKERERTQHYTRKS